MNQSSNQPINQPINQSTNQSVSLLIYQPTNQSTKSIKQQAPSSQAGRLGRGTLVSLILNRWLLVDDWLIEWLIDWLVDWLIFENSSILFDGRSKMLLFSQMSKNSQAPGPSLGAGGLLLDWLMRWLIYWLVVRVIKWLIDWLVDWFVDWLITNS